MQTGRRPSFHPAVERLEDRSLMAAHLTATLGGGVLRIDGTSHDDVITVRENAGRISVDNTPIQTAASDLGSVRDSYISKIVIYGFSGDDTITIGDRDMRSPGAISIPTTIRAGNGNDVIRGGQGNDSINCGNGNNLIWAGGGNDTVIVGNGNNKIWGDDGNDVLVGGTGTNGLYGSNGNDTIYSRSATDDIDGGYGQDTVVLGGAAVGRSTSAFRNIEPTDHPTPAPILTITLPRVAAAPTPAPTGVNLAAQEKRLLDLINAYRVKNGLRPLTVDARLTAAARYQANYMARTGHYDHVDLDGRTLADRVDAAHYSFSYVAENIHLYDPRVRRTLGVDRDFAPSQMADYFFEGWKASPPHNENLLSNVVVNVGVALAQDSKGRVFADLVLGRP